MGHPDSYGIDANGTIGWKRYLDALVMDIDVAKGPQRPVILWGYGRGAATAMTLAGRLGARVMQLIILCAEAPAPGQEVNPFEADSMMISTSSDREIVSWLSATSHDTVLLEMALSIQEGTSRIQDSAHLKGILTATKKQYNMWPDMARDMKVVRCPLKVVSGHGSKVGFDDMQYWAQWTTGPVTYETLTQAHAPLGLN
mmetsp:Transcript_27527/g.62010  ORF Transcript_27527/g.62010 Transcript_27527/m.62010 type:complete len:199 (+) Transcript_27527:75-671(+)